MPGSGTWSAETLRLQTAVVPIPTYREGVWRHGRVENARGNAAIFRFGPFDIAHAAMPPLNPWRDTHPGWACDPDPAAGTFRSVQNFFYHWAQSGLQMGQGSGHFPLHGAGRYAKMAGYFVERHMHDVMQQEDFSGGWPDIAQFGFYETQTLAG